MYCLGFFSVLISCVVLLIVQSSDGSEIIGGNEVKPHSLPFMALLEGNKGNCGGILIDEAWVLTAAHCDKIKNVLLGVHSIRRDKKKQIQKVKKSFPHPCFDAKDRVNDLMLLKLNKKVKKTETVNWLKLGNAVKDPAAESICVVAGWGATKSNAEQMSDVLRSVNVTVINRVKCNSRAYYNLDPVITSSMICAGSETADTCRGDSGGPLLCSGVLTGITSFGPKECGDKTHPGVYAFLSDKQLQWIKKIMTQN
ncbi:granzyme A-like [Pundamilia nyererei]|uniref:Granzyme A-like n=1 Tax=Pundamilia nyererei TaxID=303518 RepID=A0A9Y3VP13_9CICH|nr:PREDICTED: granzyme A-like [Pundamilia nyererei]